AGWAGWAHRARWPRWARRPRRPRWARRDGPAGRAAARACRRRSRGPCAGQQPVRRVVQDRARAVAGGDAPGDDEPTPWLDAGDLAATEPHEVDRPRPVVELGDQLRART